MSVVAIRAAVQAHLETVSGIGMVHDYLRNITDDAVLREFGVVSGAIGPLNLSMHTCEGFDQQFLTDREKVKLNRWIIHVLYTVQDAVKSEHIFQSIIHGIGDVFDADLTLGGACEQIESLAAFQPSETPHTLFIGKLCHFGVIRMVIRERLDRY